MLHNLSRDLIMPNSFQILAVPCVDTARFDFLWAGASEFRECYAQLKIQIDFE